MTANFITFASAAQIDDANLACRPITINDRAATREAMIDALRRVGKIFVERSSWSALDAKPDIESDWYYSMIALHHAGRSYSCGVGASQMMDIQKSHFSDRYSDIAYHFGIACDGAIFEGRDIRLKGGSVGGFNTGVIGIVLLENLSTADEGGDWIAKGRQLMKAVGYEKSAVVPFAQIDSLLCLVEVLRRFFVIERFGGHREYPGQLEVGKICPGNIGMKLVEDVRSVTALRAPPQRA